MLKYLLILVAACAVIVIISVVTPEECPVPEALEALNDYGITELHGDTLFYLGSDQITTTELGLLEVVSTQYIVIIGTEF
jgi:hypothetical protein